uniref:Uncharacterized protein n=1 Tax=Clytia hemisphaerica TaxID=252671 RepID=A0A7M5XKE9_9CNID
MDDILSAALGQSGLNLSFLEDQDVESAPSARSVEPATNNETISVDIPTGSLETNDFLKDDTEDVTELLNLLQDPGPANNSASSSTDSGKLADNSKKQEDVLDFLLKFQSDDEDSRPSSPAPVPSPLSILTSSFSEHNNAKKSPAGGKITSTLESRKLISITSKFPKINSTQPVISIKNANGTKTKLSSINVVRKLVKSNANSVTLANPTPAKQIVVKTTSIGGTTKGKTCSSIIKNLPEKSIQGTLINTGLKAKVTTSKVLSEDEKKKLSIQHVLASPNLTYREKQFLMKKALSANIKPSHPTLSSTVKELSTLNKRSLSPNIISSSNDYEDDDDDPDQQLIHTDTFADYMPLKVHVGYTHPDPVVETSSMASVAPPDVWYSLMLPTDIIDERKLSALQLESIVYSSQQHEKLFPDGKRAGFLIGDGAGVGKGRTVAGIIYENYLRGRKRSIWLSVSNDLRFDAIRDLQDVGCHAKVVALNKFKYDEKITSKTNGKFKKGCIFSTYSALIGETTVKARFKSRLEQLLHWCGEDFDGVIILDECHKAKNLMPVGSSKPTKTGITVLKLQDKLPKARVVYCSATGASEPKNMAYMNRLGLWGPGTAFRDFSEFLLSVEKRGVGAMEMVAMDMKLRGMYIARQLSFTGVTFDVKEVKLCASFIEMYDAAVKLWLDARGKFEKASDLVGLDGKGKKTMWGQFWSAHQRFFKYLCIAAKVKTAVDIAKHSLQTGKCVIFGLQSTGEARTLDQLDELGGELNDFISTTKGVFSTLVDKHFPTTNNPNHFATQQVINDEERKRKREWRKKTKRSKKKKGNDGVEFMSSDDDSTDSDEGSQTSTEDNSEKEDRFTTTDKDSENEDSDQEERNPFADSSEDSDDEESWLKAASEKKPKKSNNINKLKLTRIGTPDDPSANALAAAGLNLGRQYSWANATPTPPSSSQPGVSTEHMKGNRQNKVSAPQDLSQRMISMGNLRRSQSTMSAVEKCRNMKDSLIDQLEVLSPYLPPNTLDELIDELGGPENVAEMTGRKGRVVAKTDGSYAYEARTKDDVPLEVLNVAEKKRFMNAEKLVAVISEAASSGISLQADRREKNQRRRVHITLELPWSADKAIQQFGRSHRSNQVSAPEYLFLISELAGEQRFASIVAKRLESLGALTHGDRRATETRDLSRYNFDTKYGRQALDVVLKSVIGHEKPIVPLPTIKNSKTGNFLDDVKSCLIGIGLVSQDSNGIHTIADKDYTNISRFLNRILGMTVELQNGLFQYFTETLSTIVKEAKRSGRFDEGILDLGAQGECVSETNSQVFTVPSSSGQVTAELHTVSIERGLSFDKAKQMIAFSKDENEGFYISNQLRNGKNTTVLVLKNSSRSGWYSIYRPNIGLIPKPEPLSEIHKKYKKGTPVDAEPLWMDQYEYSENNCTHAYWRGYCKRKIVGLQCEVGTRKRTCHILCGSVLSVWTKIETLLSAQPGPYSKMQIIRAKLDSGAKLVV